MNQEFFFSYKDKIKTYCNTLNPESMPLFFQQMNIVLVVCSDKQEGSWPKGASQKDIVKMLMNEEELPKIPIQFSSVGTDNEGDQIKQMLQHYHAQKYLFSQPELTIDVIKSTHKLMLSGAIDHLKEPLNAGEFRTEPISAGNHVFIKFELIEKSLHHCLKKFDNALAAKEDPIKTATDLMYNVLQIHPFVDGNGRLCRMLLAFALIRTSFIPFPVPLTSGHKSSRHHYIQAIKNRQDKEMPNDLYYLVLASAIRVWKNYYTFIGNNF